MIFFRLLAATSVAALVAANRALAATPFTTYAFPATNAPTSRTLPVRLAETTNVRDWGAKGDGVTDDWAAIMAAFNWTVGINRGTIFFPPGTYLVSQPLDVSGANIKFQFIGSCDASTIVGNFGDFVFKRTSTDGSLGHSFEKLTIINSHASGGGIRAGGSILTAIRNCKITANRGINTADSDVAAPLNSLEVSISNCSVTAYTTGASGSYGIASISDGPILNCRVIGYETGMTFWANQGCMNVLGCYFERNTTGIRTGVPGVFTGPATGITVAGSWFKDNGTAIGFLGPSINGRFIGLRIEASESVTVGGARPQYGLRLNDNQCRSSFFSGILVTGQFDQYGIFVASHAGSFDREFNTFMGVRSFNTSTHGGQAWFVPTNAGYTTFIECNCPASVFTVANLPTVSGTVSAGSWSSGSATLTVSIDASRFTSAPTTVTIAGITPSGYNGTFLVTSHTNNTVTYTVADPGGSVSVGGTIIANVGKSNDASQLAYEGDSYNVNNCVSGTWGAIALGAGSVHAKVRWNGSNWTVVGK